MVPKIVDGFLACPQCGAAGREVVEAHERTVTVMRYTMVGTKPADRLIEYCGGDNEKVTADEITVILHCTFCGHSWKPPRGWGVDRTMIVLFNQDRGLLPGVQHNGDVTDSSS